VRFLIFTDFNSSHLISSKKEEYQAQAQAQEILKKLSQSSTFDE